MRFNHAYVKKFGTVLLIANQVSYLKFLITAPLITLS